MTDTDELRSDVKELRTDLKAVCENVAKLVGESRILPLLCKWVIFPLIVVTGGLAGVNLLM